MTKFSHTGLAAVTAFFVLAAVAQAQQAPPAAGAPKEGQQGRIVEVQIPIAVLDVQAILREASAVKNIRDQITEYGTKFENDIEKERDKIREANQELARQRTILAPEAFNEKRRKFEQRVVEVQRLVQKLQRDLDQSRNEAMLAVNKAYTNIVARLANQKNLAVILRKSQTVYSVATLDITKEVLTLLDKTLPTVKVSKPGTVKAETPKPKDAKSGK